MGFRGGLVAVYSVQGVGFRIRGCEQAHQGFNPDPKPDLREVLLA